MRVDSGAVQVQASIAESPLPNTKASVSTLTNNGGQAVDFGPPTSSRYAGSATPSPSGLPAGALEAESAGTLLEALAALFQGKSKQVEGVRSPVADLPAAKATEKVANKTDPAILTSIDDSEFSSPEQLKKWDNLVSHLPPGQREAAAKELNRPYAAAKMALGKGQVAEGAMAYIQANPALRTAIDTGSGGSKRNIMADGKISDKDLKAFAGEMEKRAKEAGAMMEEYRKENPDADPQSQSMVRSAALMYANDPILKAASPMKAVGTEGQDDTRHANRSDFEALADPAHNPDLSPLLAESANLWANPGMFDILDDAGLRGKDVARHGGDGLVDKGDFTSFIENLAPKSGAEFADFMTHAAMLNAASKVDIDKLDNDIFVHPDQYTGGAKFAVMMELQRAQQYVMAGREIRKTDQTEKELQKKIEMLQDDHDVQYFMEDQIKIDKQQIINSSPELSRSVDRYLKTEVFTGNSLKKGLEQKDGKLGEDQVTRALDEFRDEVLQYQDMTGTTLEIADIVAVRPDLASAIRSVVPEVNSGKPLSELATQDGVSPEQALDGYWTTVASIDDALAKAPGGSPGMPKREVVENALAHAGIDPQGMVGINDATLQGLLKKSDSMLPELRDQQTGRGNELLDKVKDKASKKVTKQAAKQGAKYATKMVANLAGRAVTAAAGQAAGATTAGTISAAAGPVGWVAGAAVSLGFGIAELVNVFKEKTKKRRERRDFDQTVSPTLDQFKIAKPK